MAEVITALDRCLFAWILFSSLVPGTTQHEGPFGEGSTNLSATTVRETQYGNKVETWKDVDKNACNGKRDAEYELISKLLNGYDKNVRPVKRKDQAIEVIFDLAYNQLVDLDGKKQILTSKVWVRQFWKNSYLTWNKTKYCGISTIQLNPDLIWTPDVVLYNSIGISSSGEMYKFNTMIILHNDGTNEWYAPTEIKSICHIDIAYFPFDYQNCFLKFGSWTHSSRMLNFTLKRQGSADLSMYYINGEWELLGVPAKRHSIKYTCCKDPFIDITYKIRLKRRVLFYLNNLVIPNLILAGLVICSFYVPPESGERISLNITIMLGLTVFLLLFNERIPPSSDKVPLIGGYYFALFYQVGISMMMTCVSSRCYHHKPFREMPNWFRFIIFRVLSPLFRMDRNYLTDKQKTVKEQDAMKLKCKKHQQLLLCRSNSDLKKKKEAESSNPSCEHSQCESTIREAKLSEITQKLQVFVDYIKNNEELDAKRNEWHFASIVLDKLFFWLFVASILLTTLMFYVRIGKSIPGTPDVDLNN